MFCFALLLRLTPIESINEFFVKCAAPSWGGLVQFEEKPYLFGQTKSTHWKYLHPMRWRVDEIIYTATAIINYQEIYCPLIMASNCMQISIIRALSLLTLIVIVIVHTIIYFLHSKTIDKPLFTGLSRQQLNAAMWSN